MIVSETEKLRLGTMERLICWLLCCFLILFNTVFTRGEQSPSQLHLPGEKAYLTWKLPPGKFNPLSIGRKNADGSVTMLFYGSTEFSETSPYPDYQDRISIMDSLDAQVPQVAFTLMNVTAEDAGHYVCVHSFGDAPIIPECGQTLIVLGKPENATIVPSSIPVENKPLTLHCSISSTSLPPDHNLPLTVEWTGPVPTLTDAESLVQKKGIELVFASVRRSDGGSKFQCRGTDDVSRDLWSELSAEYELIPEYGPRESDIAMQRSRISANQGSALQQQCSATCNPDCSVTWERKQIGQENWIELKEALGGLLDFPTVDRYDSGRYRCLALNRHGSASRLLDIDVKYIPSIHARFVNDQEIGISHRPEGENVTLKCKFDSNPAPSVRWYSMADKDRTLLEENLAGQEADLVTDSMMPRAFYTSELLLTNIRCADTSKIICEASNELGSGFAGEIQLDVLCMPRNTRGDLSLKQVYLSPDTQSFSIDFQVEAFPQPKVSRIVSEDAKGLRELEVEGTSWTVRATFTPATPYLTTFHLTFPRMSPQYFDRTYYLYIENTQGEKVFAFTLRERGAPKPPKELSIVRISESEVQISWIPGFHGGKPQTFAVEHNLYAAVTENSEKTLDWVSTPTNFKRSSDETKREMNVGGLSPGTKYAVRVVAINEYGNTSSSLLTITTLAAAAAGADGAAIAGALIAVIVVIVVVVVIVYIFVIKPRRRNRDDDNTTKEPMLDDAHVVYANERLAQDSPPQKQRDSGGKQENANNNAATDIDIVLPPVVPQRPPVSKKPDKKKSDGLIYAELDLSKPSETTPVPVRKDAVNYEVIDFQRKPPPNDPHDIELPSDEEELPSKK